MSDPQPPHRSPGSVAENPAEAIPATPPPPLVVPLAEEQVAVGKESRETGRVVVHVVPLVRTETLEVPLADEHVDVQRVLVNRFVHAAEPVRQDGDVTIIPVYEEVLVVERRLMLKEEIHVTRRKSTRTERQEITVRSEEARVLRADGPAESPPPAPPAH